MLPYVNMINQDHNGTRRQANEAQAAAIYQGFRQTGRLVRSATHALWCLGAASVGALHHLRPKAARVSRDATDRTSPC